MILTIDNLIDSIAGVLKTGYPSIPVYSSANQQGTSYPCFFVQEMPSYTHPEMNDRNRREIGVDVVYVQQRNVPNARADVRQVIDYLDEMTEVFPYTDGTDTCPIRAFDRAWSYEDQELHYKMTFRLIVGRERDNILMQTMEEEDVEVKKE